VAGEDSGGTGGDGVIQNQSRLTEVEKCPRRYAHRYLFNLAPQQSSLKADRGNWVHAGLAGWYKSMNAEVALRAYDEAFKMSGRELAIKEVAETYTLWRTRLAEYCRVQRDPMFRVLMVPEQELVLPVGRHKLYTRVDLIIQMIDNNAIWVMDHKTAERTGPSWFTKYYVDKQGSSYILAVATQLGTEPVGWMINVVKSTKADWFERQAFTRQKDQLDSFLRQTEKQLDRLEKAVVEFPGEEDPGVAAYLDERFPQHTHECHQWGTCAFISICQAGLKAARSSFKERERDYVDDQRDLAGLGGTGHSGASNTPKEA
jgi:hypothetical protein